MLSLCPNCAFPNLPATINCCRCGYQIQSAEDSIRRQQEWSELPPSVRAEFESKYQSAQLQYRQHLRKSKGTLLKMALLSGGILGLTGLLHGGMIVSDILLGCLSGFLLVVINSGRYRGLLLFGGSYFISFLIKNALDLSYGNPFGGSAPAGLSLQGAVTLLFMSGFLLSICLGYVIGMTREDRR